MTKTFEGFDEIPPIYPPRDENGAYASQDSAEWFSADLFNRNAARVLQEEGIGNDEPQGYTSRPRQFPEWIKVEEARDWDEAQLAIHQRVIEKFPGLDEAQHLYDRVYDIAHDIIKKTQKR